MVGIALLVVFVLTAYLGTELVRNADPEQYPVLVFALNAVQGVVLVGAILVAGSAEDWAPLVISLVVVVLATASLVGGWVLTGRAVADAGYREDV